MQPLHGDATRVVEVGNTQAHGSIGGIHHQVSRHKHCPRLVEPRLSVIIQPEKGMTEFHKESAQQRPGQPAPIQSVTKDMQPPRIGGYRPLQEAFPPEMPV